MTTENSQQPALITSPARSKNVQAGLEALAQKKIDLLKASGAINEQNELEAGLIIDLARSYSQTRAGYAKAQMARVVIDALQELLPAEQPADMWQTIADLVGDLEDLADYGTAPAYATRIDKRAPHQLSQIRLVASLLGTPLMPWQNYAARIISQRTPDRARWRYRTVIITVPRQSGKTTLMRAVLTQRAITRAATRAWLTAQTGKDASERWKDLISELASSALQPYTQTRMSAGSQQLTITPTASTIRPFSPKAEALHGYTASDIVIDEAFAFDDAQGSDLMGGVGPTMATVDDSQLIIISTAGNPESTWLKSWVDKGRASINDPDSELAYLEWSSASSDPYDPAAIDFHPALGRTISRDKLLAEAANQPPSEWKRAYLNQWTKASSEPLIDPAIWQSLAVSSQSKPATDAPIGVGYETALDESRASIVAAWISDDGKAHQRLIAQGEGTAWLVPAIKQTLETLGAAARLVADDGGTTTRVTEALEREGIPVDKLSGKEFARACSGWHSRVMAGSIDHEANDNDPIADQLQLAATRAFSDSWAISRRHSPGAVDAIIASAAALRVVELTPAASSLEIVTSDD